MAACVPVVTTAVGGIPDLMERGTFGALVEPGNAEAIATMLLERVQAGKDNAQLGRARDSALKRYGSKRLISDLETLYLGLLKHAHIPVEGESL